MQTILASIKGFNASEFNYYPGTHIRVQLPVSYKLGKNIITGLVDRQDVMSPYHHSFVKFITTFKRAERFLESKDGKESCVNRVKWSAR
jgi:hypothetical protein